MTSQLPLPEERISPVPDNLGKPLDDMVGIHIDYAIIQHFSQHLYGSPNKAVEELVANAYDAFATKVYVYVHGRYVTDRVVVWDDGESMDETGLHRLWWIARSPKDDGTDRIETRPGRAPRALIGKFGIGKLASYAVGTRITHLCKQDGRYLRVTFDYKEIPHITEDNQSVLYRAPILELTATETESYVDGIFAETPTAKADLWDEGRWTVAVIDNLREDVALYEGRLAWVLGNGMPSRPDFRAQLNDRAVEPKIGEGAFQQWTMANQSVRDELLADWEEKIEEGSSDYIAGTLRFEDDVAIFPALGPVRATIRLFEESLLRGRGTEIARSFGFFIMVRDRLINPDDAEFYLHPPSYGTFYRSQFVIQADGLDDVLLADRERLFRNSAKTAELELLQQTLYLVARNALQQKDTEVQASRRSAALLPVQSHEHFREPLGALLLRYPEVTATDLQLSEISRKPLGTSEPLAVVDEGGSFKVNSSHPLFSALADKLGGGERAREALRAFDLVSVAERLLEGKLFDMGLDDDTVAEIMDWRDGLFRLIAERYETADDEIAEEVRAASYLTDKPFERALQKLFQRMGFEATHAGASGEKDVLVVAPIGRKEFTFIVEAKGKAQGAVANDDAEVGQAAGHLEGAGAEFAVVVAREFVGFVRSQGEPAILRDCRALDGKVFIATVDTLVELYKAVSEFAYPLDVVRQALTVVESPDAKLQRVQELRHPTEDFDFRAVLQAIWEYQSGQGSRDVVPYRAVWQQNPEWRERMEITEFTAKLVALETLARGLIRVWPKRLEVTMVQSPDVVATQIARSVEERSTDGSSIG